MRLCLVLCAAVVLAACGGSSHPRTQRVSTPTTSQSAATTPAMTTSTASTPVAQAGTPACAAADLALSYIGGQGATGHGELGFQLRNTSSVTCHTYGFPGVEFLDQGGGALPTVPRRTTQDYFGSLPAVKLTVAPGQSVSFRLGVTHGISSTAGCTTAYGVQVIAPDDTAKLRAAIPGGSYECQTVTVSPLAPGTTAYP